MIIRNDLPLGTMLAQTTHASGESASCFGQLPSGTHAVVLAAKDEADLLNIEQQLLSASINYRLIREPDPPFNGQAMAIGLIPTNDRKKIRQILSRHPLVK